MYNTSAINACSKLFKLRGFVNNYVLSFENKLLGSQTL